MNNYFVERDIFLQAIRKPDEEARDRFLAEACGDNIALQKSIEALLTQHTKNGDLLDSLDTPSGDTTFSDVDPSFITFTPGKQVGAYELCEPIGEGGMGIVYRAVQTRLGKRTVALKLIKPGMDSREVIARFEAERQVLAMLDHPGIAKVLDGGATEQGRPFFVMELVDGEPVTDFCDRRRVGLRERLRLFQQVCDAVQHAHYKGIVHRDIKPSNVLVTDSGEKPGIKVIDFGVSKALNHQRDETFWTGASRLIGTPLYMSPEQARLDQHDIDTRTDVYSLGVLLYELLTGTTPFDRQELRAATVEQLRDIIARREPLKPSLRAAKLGTAEAAACRRLDSKRLVTSIQGDLDWIVVKALEKDRERRYSTASALSRDVERHLMDEPIEAGPPSRIYRLRKLAKRHKASLVTAMLFVAVLVTGIVGTASMAIQARRARDRAVEAEALALSRQANVELAKLETENALTLARQSADEQRRLRESAESRELYLQKLIYASDIRMASESWKAGDVKQCFDLLTAYGGVAGLGGHEHLRGFECGLLESLATAKHQTLNPSQGDNQLARFLGPHKRLVTAGAKIRIYDDFQEQPIISLPGHGAVINGVDISPNGKTLASIGDDGKVHLWDLADGRRLAAFQVDAGHGHRVYFVQEGRILLTSGEESRVKIWDAVSLDQVGELDGFSEEPNRGIKWRLTCSDDRKRFAAADLLNKARVYDGVTNEVICDLELAGEGFVRCLQFSPDGRWVAGGRQTHAVTLWDAQTGEVLEQFQGHFDDVQDVKFHPNGRQLASCDRAGLVRFWPIGNGVAGDEDTNRHDGQWPSAFAAHDDRVWSLAFSPTGTELVTASRDNTVRIWPASAPRPLLPLATGIEPRLCWLDRSTLALASSEGLVFWSPRSDAQSSSAPLDSRIRSMATSDDKRWLATGHTNGVASLWNAANRQVVQTWSGHDDAILCIAFSKDAEHVASGGEDGQILVRNVSTGNVDRIIRHQHPCNSLGFSKDGRLLAAAVQDDILVYDLRNESVVRLTGHQNSADCLVFSPDGRWLASGSDDRTVRIWNVNDLSERRVIQAHKSKIESIAFSPDSKTVASGDKEGVVVFSQAETGRRLYGTHIGTHWRDLDARDPWISDLRFSPDGNQLAVDIYGAGAIVLEQETRFTIGRAPLVGFAVAGDPRDPRPKHQRQPQPPAPVSKE